MTLSRELVLAASRRAQTTRHPGRARRLAGIDSQAVIHGRQHVLRRDGPVGRIGSAASLAPTTWPASNASAGHGDAPDAGPMVAAAGRVDARCTAKFAGGDHQRRLQPATPLEIVDQGREARSKIGKQDASIVVESAERRPAVTVPGDLIEDGLEHVDRHDADARLDQPTGQQTALPERCATVLIAQRLRLGGQVEGIIAEGTRD